MAGHDTSIPICYLRRGRELPPACVLTRKLFEGFRSACMSQEPAMAATAGEYRANNSRD